VPGKTRYPRQWEWQDDAKIAMPVNLALEAFRFKSQYTQEGRRGRVDHFSLSDGEYGAKAGIWRASRLRPAEFRPEARGTRHVAAGWPVSNLVGCSTETSCLRQGPQIPLLISVE
jgi:hypothetical protein